MRELILTNAAKALFIVVLLGLVLLVTVLTMAVLMADNYEEAEEFFDKEDKKDV